MNLDFLNKIIFRDATTSDVDFIVETIIEAEKSGTDCISSCNIFCFSPEYFKSLLKNILLKDYSDYEYSLSGFTVAEYLGYPIGALGSWIEEENDTPSFMIKANELIPSILAEKKEIAINNLKAIRGFSLKLEKQAVQLEYGYVVEEHRRKKVFTNLILQNIKKHVTRKASFNLIQTNMLKANYKSFNAYVNLGFVINEEKIMTNSEVLTLFPSDTKVSLMIEKNNILPLLKHLYD